MEDKGDRQEQGGKVAGDGKVGHLRRAGACRAPRSGWSRWHTGAFAACQVLIRVSTTAL